MIRPDLILLAIIYLGLAFGKIPGFRMNRATIALIGSGFLIVLGVLNLEEAWKAIDANTIVFLLSMMVVNAHLAYSGFFQLALDFLLRLTTSPLGLITVLSLGSGLLSALFLNDTIALIFTPLTLNLTQTLKLNPIPYLLAVSAATNSGSVATISGNPQNILIGSFSGISYSYFATALTPIALISLVIQVLLLYLLYPEVRSLQAIAPIPIIRYRLVKPIFKKTILVTICLLIAFVMGVPLGEAALAAACFLLLTRRIKPEKPLKQVDWNLLVMFSGLFILTKATSKLNLLQIFTPLANNSLGLLTAVGLLSNIVSNVPAVLLLQPLIAPEDSKSWLILAAGSTLAGNLTLFGSVANLIIVESAAKLGHKLTFMEHLRFGLPLSAITLILSYFWLH